jgi:hypothetical protein
MKHEYTTILMNFKNIFLDEKSQSQKNMKYKKTVETELKVWLLKAKSKGDEVKDC